MNTGGPASEKTLLDEFAGQALAGFFGFISETQATMKDAGLPGIKREQVSRECYDQAESMLAEKARREATGKDSLTVQAREVDDDRWAKFQDGIRISFQPTIGWCAEIRDGSMGYGNTIAEAIANLRARWEERSAAPVVQQSSTTDDAGKVDLSQEDRIRIRVNRLESANKELVQALGRMVLDADKRLEHEELNGDAISAASTRGTYCALRDALHIAKQILNKHKGDA